VCFIKMENQAKDIKYLLCQNYVVWNVVSCSLADRYQTVRNYVQEDSDHNIYHCDRGMRLPKKPKSIYPYSITERNF
jgi:hypothetical protein